MTTDEGRWLEGLDERTEHDERERQKANMSDDLTEAVAEALVRLHVDDPSDHAIHIESERAAARAALDAIIAQGGVTDDEIRDAILPLLSTKAVRTLRALMARAVATACAERDAEIERLRHFERVHDGWKARAERAEAERDELRAEVERLTDEAASWRRTLETMTGERDAAEAQVQRVRELADEWERREFDPWYWSEPAGEVRAALDGEADHERG